MLSFSILCAALIACVVPRELPALPMPEQAPPPDPKFVAWLARLDFVALIHERTAPTDRSLMRAAFDAGMSPVDAFHLPRYDG